MTFLSYVFPAAAILLQLALIVLLARGPFRRYPVLLVYSIAYIGVMVLEGLAFTQAGVDSALYRHLYWTSDLVLDFLLFLMVITLTYRVVAGNPLLRPFARMLFLVAAAAIVLPFILFHPLFQFGWFRHTSQLLSFGAALMNLLLWTAIIGTRDRDPQLLSVSAGLGVAVTGIAITYGLLQFTSTSFRWLPDLFKSLTQVGSMVIWCWAFRPSASEPSSRIEAVPDPS
jgi:hypothetical protein